LIIGLIVGGGLGLLIGWLTGHARGGGGSDSRLENVLQEQIKQRETELTQLRGQLTEAGNARASAEASRVAAEKLVAEQRALQDKALADLR